MNGPFRSLFAALPLVAAVLIPWTYPRSQVPYRHILVVELSGSALRSLFTYLDPSNGVTTPLLPQSGAPVQRQGGSVALDPLDPLALFSSGGISISVRPSYTTLRLEGSRHGTPTTQTMTGLIGAIARMWIHGTDMLAAVGGSLGGLYRWPISAPAASLIIPLVHAHDVVLIENKAYVSSYQTGQPSTVVEIDLVTNVTVTYGTNYPTLKALTSLGTVVVGAGEDGNLYAITPGNAILIAAPNRGLIVAAAADPGGGFWFATSNEVIRYPGLAVLQRFTGPISDIEVGTSMQGSLVTAGSGCAGTTSSAPHHLFGGRPSLGNASWSMRMAGGAAHAPTFLLLGGGRTTFGGLPLPLDLGVIGMPGCQLYTDRIYSMTTLLDGSGTGSVPLPVPNDMALTGGRLTGQFVVLTLGANPLGLLTSDVAGGILY